MPADLKLHVVQTSVEHTSRYIVALDNNWPTREEAEAAIARYDAAVVESSPEVAALRRERDELRATLDRIVSVVRSKCDWSWTDQAMVNASLAEAERLLNRNPTGDDHG